MADELKNLCQWCGGDVVRSTRGRYRLYCSQKCRQAAYQLRYAQRQALAAGWSPPSKG